MPHEDGGTESVIAESERLRRNLLRAAARMEVFSTELMAEAQTLKDEAANFQEGHDHERGDDPGEEPGPAGTGGPADQHGSGADG